MWRLLYLVLTLSAVPLAKSKEKFIPLGGHQKDVVDPGKSKQSSGHGGGLLKLTGGGHHHSNGHSKDHKTSTDGGEESSHAKIGKPPKHWDPGYDRKGILPSFEESTSPHFPGGIPLTSTTTPLVPEIFRAELRGRATIDEKATDYLPAEKAVRDMEREVGWDPASSTFVNKPQAIAALAEQGGLQRGGAAQLSSLPMLMDIVIPSIRDLDFLEQWRPYLEGFHLILVQDGDPDKYLKIPPWADYELYNRRDIEAALGDRAWIISQKDASIRNFGFLVSKKKLVYTVDDDCRPAMGPDGKTPVNAVLEHARNLLAPATPYFFNTVYDPYRDGSDFVRGFPYSLRAGVATAVSHGLWMHNYDYDAPTQLLKVEEKNERYVDAAITVPKGVLYPLCSMNVAFNRELIGPAFMQGLMGKGQPWGRYDDMWAGWASKTVADHLGVGCKSGHPYIKHNKASNPFVNLMKEYKGLEWQEEVIRFFDTVQLSEASRNDAGDAYIDLSWHVHTKLGHLNPYFERLGLAMRTWVEVWREAQSERISFVPSRRSGNGPVASERAAKPSADSMSSMVLSPPTDGLRGAVQAVGYAKPDFPEGSLSTDSRSVVLQHAATSAAARSTESRVDFGSLTPAAEASKPGHAPGSYTKPPPPSTEASRGGLLQCRPALLHLKDKNGERTVVIERDVCQLYFDGTNGGQDCTTFRKITADNFSASSGAIATSSAVDPNTVKALAAPQPIVLLVKMGSSSPFAGDRADLLYKLVLDLAVAAASGKLRVQVVFLCDMSGWAKTAGNLGPSDVLPEPLSHLIVPYTVADVKRIFPTRKLQKSARARAIIKYYETYSWSWWWEVHGKPSGVVKRVWTVEDDTAFSGNWAAFLGALENGLDARGVASGGGRHADLMTFRDFCTPQQGWPWAKWMHEDWANLTVPGQSLETWMTMYGMSAKFLDAIVGAQKEGLTGHIEYFPPTYALRNGFKLTFIKHDLRGRRLHHGCGGEKRGGTFAYCCQGRSTADAEDWFEGWKQTGFCASPTLLHPVKGDACGRFSPNGYGRGCWSREVKKDGTLRDFFTANKNKPDHFKVLNARELQRKLN